MLGARGIEAVVTIDHTRGNQAARRWLVSDGHGNLVRLMASDYTLSSWQWRGVWGEVQSSLGTGRGYCANLGHPEDETGLVYMRARYYEPATGRFLSEDPARDGVNWYLYADGNPVNKVDESGHSAIEDISFVFFAIGMLFTTAALRGMSRADAWALLPMRGGQAFHLFRRHMIRQVLSPAQLAIISFSLAAIGLVNNQMINYVLWGVSNYAVIIQVLTYGAQTKAALRSAGGAAVAAAFTYQLILLGVIASIGAENERE